jgi:thiol:disulfide interchange protein
MQLKFWIQTQMETDMNDNTFNRCLRKWSFYDPGTVRSRMVWVVLVVMFHVACGLAAESPDRDSEPMTVRVFQHATQDKNSFEVQFDLAEKHYLYRDSLRFELLPSASDLSFELPPHQVIVDPENDASKRVYDHSFGIILSSSSELPANGSLLIHWRCCSDEECFFPSTSEFKIRDGWIRTSQPEEPISIATNLNCDDSDALGGDSWLTLMDQFDPIGKQSGYLDEDAFYAFLQGQNDQGAGELDLAAMAGQWGWMPVVCLILLGGLGLNFTPCILPMIPINLAIIGAGNQRENAKQGLLRGGVYGLSMALAYGVLGLMVVLTGARFGSLNAYPWFNWGIALVFVVLALSMFGAFQIDLSGIQGKVQWNRFRAGSLLIPFFMGGVAALLAGACVAPVLISVLLLSTDLYAEGFWLGLSLPFLLGVGMALPWPFAGAGFSVLPSPGPFLRYVKSGFGVLILAVAVYYGYEGYHLQTTRTDISLTEQQSFSTQNASSRILPQQMLHGLEQALLEQKPVLLDFGASWCKNCKAMEEVTFKQDKIQKALERFVLIKIQADQPDEPQTKAVLDTFQVMGLPTFVLLEPKTRSLNRNP